MGGRLRRLTVATVLATVAAVGSALAQSPTPAPSATPDATPDTSRAAPSDSKPEANPAPAIPPTTAEPSAPASPPDSTSPSAPTPPPSPPASPPAAQKPPPPPANSTSPPSVTVIGSKEVQGILGNEVHGPNNESMGRIVDVVVDGEGKPRAAIIDFGGFLGVGSRKIAVDWKALRFVPSASKRYSIALALTRDQVKTAPEYKEGQPIVILGASGSLEPIP
ncbi:MAG TPA: PRC-barrel domain-containing protein [Reyranella sp.]|nr:PRC-barrel domain-containing protein [Reyranella sp.]